MIDVVAVNTDVVGKSYAPTLYAVGREKLREYARAVGETNPLHLDLDAAREAGHDDLVAPPMFAVVYAMPAVAQGMFDPESGIDFSRLVHAGQEFVWGPLVIAGDEISTTLTVKDVSERRGSGFFVFESVSCNQRGETVCTGTWSNIVRGA
jgi:acyl dehydratase